MKYFAQKVLVLLMVCLLLSQTEAISLGKIRDKISKAAHKVGDVMTDAYHQAKTVVEEEGSKAASAINEITKATKESLQEAYSKTEENAKDLYKKTKKNAANLFDDTKEKLSQTESVLMESVKTQSKNLREMFSQAKDLAKKASQHVEDDIKSESGFWRNAAKFFTNIESTKEVVDKVCQFGKEKFIQVKNILVKVIKFFYQGVKKVCKIFVKVIKVTFKVAYRYVFKDMLTYASTLILGIFDKFNLKFFIHLWYTIRAIFSGITSFLSVISQLLTTFPVASSAVIGLYIVTRTVKGVYKHLW